MSNELLPNNTVTKKKKTIDEDKLLSALTELASLMDVSVETVKDECCLFQLKKFMSKLGMVVISSNVTEKEIGNVFYNSDKLSVGELCVSPQYIGWCSEQAEEQGLYNLKINALLDFPLGEDLFKNKINGIKGCFGLGVDYVTVMISDLLLKPENFKQLKKEIYKYGKIKKGKVGIAISVNNLDDEKLKTVIKLTEKSKADSLTLVFPMKDLLSPKDKICNLVKYRKTKPIKILGNVDNAQTVKALFKLKVDAILTPVSDEIGKELYKKFALKSVKLK